MRLKGFPYGERAARRAGSDAGPGRNGNVMRLAAVLLPGLERKNGWPGMLTALAARRRGPARPAVVTSDSATRVTNPGAAQQGKAARPTLAL